MKTEIHRIRVGGRKRRFSNTMTSCLGLRLALPHIRFENATCGRRFFKYGEKISVKFENTRLCVNEALYTGASYRLVNTVVVNLCIKFTSLSFVCFITVFTEVQPVSFNFYLNLILSPQRFVCLFVVLIENPSVNHFVS